MTNKLTCLRNADGEIVGYFSDHVAEMAARQEWDMLYVAKRKESRNLLSERKCRGKEVPIVAAELEDVEPGDGDRVDYRSTLTHEDIIPLTERVAHICELWLRRGASSVELQRFLINKYRRPGMSARDSDLGGPADAAGVLYVLKIKAPR